MVLWLWLSENPKKYPAAGSIVVHHNEKSSYRSNTYCNMFGIKEVSRCSYLDEVGLASYDLLGGDPAPLLAGGPLYAEAEPYASLEVDPDP